MAEPETMGSLLFQTNEDGVAVLTLNRPEKLNALDIKMGYDCPLLLRK